MPRLATTIALGVGALGVGHVPLAAQEFPTSVDCGGGPGSWSATGSVVENPTNDPVARAMLWATKECMVTADSLGRFSIRNVPAEVDRLRVSFIGYRSVLLPAERARAESPGVVIHLPIAGLPEGRDAIPLQPDVARAVIERLLSDFGAERLRRGSAEAELAAAVSGWEAALPTGPAPGATVVLRERADAAWRAFPDAVVWLRDWQERNLLRAVCADGAASCEGPTPRTVLDIVALVPVSPDSVYAPLRAQVLFADPDPCVSGQLVGDSIQYVELLVLAGAHWMRPSDHDPRTQVGGLYSSGIPRGGTAPAGQDCP